MTRMKIRFYRGPLDGKVMHRVLKPGETTIMTARPTNNFFAATAADQPVGTGYALNVETYVKTHHTHPDGSVFFEWNRPRGTRFKD